MHRHSTDHTDTATCTDIADIVQTQYIHTDHRHSTDDISTHPTDVHSIDIAQTQTQHIHTDMQTHRHRIHTQT